ncbi:hypothetical protein ACUN90_23495, partial [Escherichia sp. SP-MK2]
RMEGQLLLNTIDLIIDAAIDGHGLAYFSPRDPELWQRTLHDRDATAISVCPFRSVRSSHRG